MASTFLERALGGEVDVHDDAALHASLSSVDASISTAISEVAGVVEKERESVLGVLGYADELRTELETLRAGVHDLPHEALRTRLEGSVLCLPEMRNKLAASRSAHSDLRSLAWVHARLVDFEAAMGREDLGAAAAHVGGVRARLTELEASRPRLQGSKVLSQLLGRCSQHEASLRSRAVAAWAASALGPRGFAGPGGRPPTEKRASAPDVAPPAAVCLVSGTADGASLAGLLSALGSLGLLRGCMEELGDAVLSRLLRPALERRAGRLQVQTRHAFSRLIALVPLPAGAEAAGAPRLRVRTSELCEALSTTLGALHRFLAQARPDALDEMREAWAEAGSEPVAPLDLLGPRFFDELGRLARDSALLPSLDAEMRARSDPRSAAPEAGAADAADAGAVAREISISNSVSHEMSEAAAAMSAAVRRLCDETRTKLGSSALAPLALACAELQAHAATKRADRLIDEARSLVCAPPSDSLFVGPSVFPAAQADASAEPNDAADDATAAAAAAHDADADADADAVSAPLAPSASLTFPRCRVSRRAVELVALLEGAMSYACACGAAGAAAIYRRARDAVDLFVALSPAVHASSLRLVPFTALLLHNDALLLRHRCLTLAAEYAARLPPPLRPVATFCDFAPSLAALARESLETARRRPLPT